MLHFTITQELNYQFHFRAILSWKNRKVVQKAMKQHVSQMVWFRKLYIVFSRYMLINTLTELTIQDLELDILET